MVNKLLSKLTQNLLEILNDEEYYDITIEVGSDPYVKVLAHIKLPNVSPEIFQIILRYIYGGELSLDEYDTSDIIKVLFAASELSLQELIAYLQSYLIKNKTSWLEQNFDLLYQKSFENDSFLELQKYCTELMTKEPNKIFNSLNFSSIPEKLLISIIQNDNLQMSDIQVWENGLKWGIAQNPELPSDVTNYSDHDFNNLKNTLQQCIPLVKFNNLTFKEFMDKVLPYDQILPKKLYKDLLKTFLSLSDPNSRPSDKAKLYTIKEIDSKIITYQHVELISKWIDRLEITDKLTSPYEFKLLFHRSRINSEKFHEICDNQSRTVIIVKVKDSSEILGGYNPIEWNSNGNYGSTKESFIFSFNDRIENYILSRVLNENYAIYNGELITTSFGGGDLTIAGNYGQSKKLNYEKPIRKGFIIEECEVFQIV